jgi:hypothetical protein
MKVSAIGLLHRSADLLPKRATVENQADMHRFLLREMARHIEQVQKGDLPLQEFAEFYCIVPAAQPSRESGVQE